MRRLIASVVSLLLIGAFIPATAFAEAPLTRVSAAAADEGAALSGAEPKRDGRAEPGGQAEPGGLAELSSPPVVDGADEADGAGEPPSPPVTQEDSSPAGENPATPDGNGTTSPAAPAAPTPAENDAPVAPAAGGTEDAPAESAPSAPSAENEAGSTTLSPLAATPAFPERYLIRPASSLAKVLDVSGASKASCADVWLYPSNMTGAQSFTITEVKDRPGYYTIVNTNSGMPLDVAGASTTSGTKVWQYATNNTVAQQWRITADAKGGFVITSAVSDRLVLTVAGSGDETKGAVCVATPSDRTTQRFYLIPLGTLVASPAPVPASVSSGDHVITSALSRDMVLDIPGASDAQGAQLQIYRRNATLAQDFRVTFGADGYATLCALTSGLTLGASGGNLVATTPVVQSGASSSDLTQKWVVQQNNDNTLTFINAASGLALDVTGAAAVSGTRIWLYTPNNTAAQKFTLATSGDVLGDKAIISLVPRTRASYRVDITSASRASGANAQAYPSNDTLAQKFQVNALGGSSYRMENVNSGLCLAAAGDTVVQAKGTDDTSVWEATRALGGIVFTNVATGRMMTLAGTDIALASSGAQTTSAELFKTAGATIIPTGAYYSFTTPNGFALDVSGNSLNSGANIQLYWANGTAAQKFSVKALDSSLIITGAASRKALDVSGASTKDGANIWQYTPNSTAAQKWEILYSGGGWFNLRSSLGTFLAAESDASGANVYSTTKVSQALKFRFAQVSYVPVTITQDFRSVFYHGSKPAPYQKYIVLHDTEGDGSPANVINWWAGNGNLVAAHFVIGKDGSIHQCVPLDTIAHHAGYGNTGHNTFYGVPEDGRDDMKGSKPIGKWAADYGMNAWSIGIELVHVGGRGSYPEAQLKALDDLIAYIDAYYGFESSIIDHEAWRSGNSDTSKEFAQYLSNYQKYRRHLP